MVNKVREEIWNEFFTDVYGVIEASREEYSYLYRTLKNSENFTVTENLSGVTVVVGTLMDRPICISIWNMTVNGKKVIMWEPTSMLVDYAMIEEWWDGNWPDKAYRDNGSRKNRSDASNAFNVFHSLNEKELLTI